MVRSGFAHGYAVTSGICDRSACGDLRYLRYFMRCCDGSTNAMSFAMVFAPLAVLAVKQRWARPCEVSFTLD